MSHDELSALLVRIMWGTNYGAEMNVFTCKLAKQRRRRGLMVKFKRGRTANPKRLKVRRFSTGRLQISKLFCLVGMRVGEEKQVQYKNFLGNCNTTLVSTKTSSKSDMSRTGLK